MHQIKHGSAASAAKQANNAANLNLAQGGRREATRMQQRKDLEQLIVAIRRGITHEGERVELRFMAGAQSHVDEMEE